MPAAAKNGARVYFGWDSREGWAFEVAEATLREHSSIPLHVEAVRADHLKRYGLLRRPVCRLQTSRAFIHGQGGIARQTVPKGVLWDVISGAPMSTEFANARFLVPHLAQSGWVLFADPDVVVLADIAELFALADPRYALMCVQHGVLTQEGLKMDGQIQLPYFRKNWSSVILWNCDHPGNRRLTPELINTLPGRDLHRFCWLRDEEIGRLPRAWNWLVNVQPCPDHPRLAHFTLGGPWLPGWSEQPYDDLWRESAARVGSGNRARDARAGEAALSGRSGSNG